MTFSRSFPFRLFVAFLLTTPWLAHGASSVTLISSPNPARYGSPVTLDATVSPTDATGKVTFYDGIVILGVEPVSGGHAKLATILLPTGQRSLKAYYSGDGTNASSLSAAVAQTITTIASDGFHSPVSIPVGLQGNPFSPIATGDFNGDGKVDFAGVSSNHLDIFLNQGNGSFGTPQIYTINGMFALGAVDCNGDGNTDLIATTYTGFQVLLGNGDGTFTTQPAQNNGSGGSRMVISDFNGDGKADFAVADGAQSQIEVYLGTGDGTFTAKATYPLSSAPNYLVQADINGDGTADFIFDSGSNIQVLLGNGDGTFHVGGTFATDQGYFGQESSAAIAVGDFNGDGRLDLAVNNEGSFLIGILLGNGDGTFASPRIVSGRTEYGDMVAEDFTGDGKIDLAFGSLQTQILAGNGDGTFQAAVKYTLTLGSSAITMKTADLDGDGIPDLLLAAYNGPGLLINGANPILQPTLAAPGGFAAGQVGARYTLNVANAGSYPTSTPVNVTVSPAASLTVTAMSGLGWTCTIATLSCSRSDALAPGASFPLLTVWVNVAGNATGTVKSSVNVTGGSKTNQATTTGSVTVTLLSSTTITLSASPNPSSVGHAVNLTASVSGGAGSVTFYDGTTVLGTASLSALQAQLTTLQLPAGTRSLYARYNGDASHAVSISAPAIQTVASLSGGGFTQSTLSVGSNPYFATAADVNGDGKEDVILTSPSNSVIVLLGKGNGTFQQLSAISLSDYPNSIAVGDFDLDGKPDLAVGMNNAGKLAILKGNGDGTFQAPHYIAMDVINSLSVADFDGDGKPDLVTALWYPGGVAVLLGNGDGTFQAPLKTLNGLGYEGPLTVGDFNGDGKPDVAVIALTGSQVLVILGNGDGTFQAPATISINQGAALAVGDLNGDGKLDLVVASQIPLVYVALGNGDGTFQSPASYSAGSYDSAAAIGDFNGDGKLDVAIVSNGLSQVAILPGNGDGTLGTAATISTGAAPYGLAIGDFNGDGATDLVVPNSGVTNVTLLLGTGGKMLIRSSHSGNFVAGQTGTFSVVVSNSSLSTIAGTVTVADILPLGLSATAISGSGWTCALDTVSCSRSDGLTSSTAYPAIVVSVAVAGNLGVSNLTNHVTATTDKAQAAFDDITHIVLPSGISLQTSGSPSVYGANATLTATISVGGGGKVLFFDGATILGIAPVTAGKSLLTTRLLPTGTRALRASYTGDTSYGPSTSAAVAQVVSAAAAWGWNSPVTYAAGTQPCCLVAEDFNQDGHTDLAVLSRGSGNVRVFLGNGDGTFQTGVDYAAGTAPVALAAGDLNGDGKTDLATADQQGVRAVVLLGNGDGSFRAPVGYPICPGAACGPVSITAADVNADGTPDLTLVDMYTYNRSVLMGNGDGTFQSSIEAPLLAQSNYATMADLNGDGKPDILTAGTGPTLSVQLGNGDGTFQIAKSFTLPYPPPTSVTVGDLNGDGALDLIAANNTNSLSVLMGNGDGTFQSATAASTGGQADLAVVGDLDGDGRQDILTGDGNIGHSNVYALLGNGNGSVQLPSPYAAGNAPYVVALGDFNGDGRTDVAALNYFDNNLTILLGQAPPSQPPSLSLTKVHLGNFTFGQSNAKYTVTVSNAAGAGPTNGTVMVTDNLPAGLTVVDMSGTGWSCQGTTCSRADRLGPGQSYAPILVTAMVSPTAGSSLTNQVTVSGGGSSGANASDLATITQVSMCDLDQDGHTNAVDIQSIVKRALGVQSIMDLNHDGVVNVADIQLVLDAVAGAGCGVQ